MKNKYVFLANVAIIAAIAFSLSSCSPFIDKRGFNHETFDETKIIIGKDTKDTVMEKFGSPSTTTLFPTAPGKGGYKWFYITKKTATTAFFKPETLEQQTIIVAFDASDKVTEVKKIVGEAMIEPNKNQTESTGYESNTLRDVFGNFGRYSGKSTSSSSSK